MGKWGLWGLIICLLIVCTSPVFAAQKSTFSDVPQNHWAYAAVTQLAKEGIVSGYSDGKFSGDRTLSRYEMAVIVANAMTKVDTANGQQRALIEKLAKEFSDELAALNVRMAKVERKTAWSFNIEYRIGYTYNSAGGSSKPAGYLGNKIEEKNAFFERIRLFYSVPINDVWTYGGRIYQGKYNWFLSDNTTTARFDRNWVSGKVLGGKLDMGKQMLFVGKSGFFAQTGDTDGVFYSFYNKDKSLYGRVGTARSPTVLEASKTRDLSFAEFKWQVSKTADIGAMTIKQAGYGGIDDLNIVAINGATKLGDNTNLSVAFEYAKNYASATGYNGKTGYWVGLFSAYGYPTTSTPGTYWPLVDPKNTKSTGWAVSYRHLPSGVAGQINRGATYAWTQGNCDSAGTYQNAVDNVNAWNFLYQFVPWKNVLASVTFDHASPISGTSWTNNSVSIGLAFLF
jgi:hypothetical protein